MTTARFPSLLVRRTALEARGPFAEAQAAFLSPDPSTIETLDALARSKEAGIVAHYYMDPELQGVLSRLTWPHVWISDSLLMADKAVEMARAGARRIVVLGVDFMAENARAMLDAAGFGAVPVYRVAAEPIGCSLAAAAESLSYGAWLMHAAETPRSLHVVYINTSLRTKARAHALVPTITCTSSNVVATVLDAFATIPDVSVHFGPDTYMGQNLARMFEIYAGEPDEVAGSLHPKHTAATIEAARARFHYFGQGNCIVHHMFGADVVARTRAAHPDAYVTAHLEVPGEMFELALEARSRGRGVVGSTADILSFIVARVREASARPGPSTLEFVLGTEAGMITSIVRETQRALAASGRDDVACEIVFPVASEAVARTDDAELGIVPGVAGGEGCTTAGGCATCPYMKMNSLDALVTLLSRLDVEDDDRLADFHPRVLSELVGGKTIAVLGGEPILHMRAFQRDKRLPRALIDDVLARTPRSAVTHATR